MILIGTINSVSTCNSYAIMKILWKKHFFPAKTKIILFERLSLSLLRVSISKFPEHACVVYVNRPEILDDLKATIRQEMQHTYVYAFNFVILRFCYCHKILLKCALSNSIIKNNKSFLQKTIPCVFKKFASLRVQFMYIPWKHTTVYPFNYIITWSISSGSIIYLYFLW